MPTEERKSTIEAYLASDTGRHLADAHPGLEFVIVAVPDESRLDRFADHVLASVTSALPSGAAEPPVPANTAIACNDSSTRACFAERGFSLLAPLRRSDVSSNKVREMMMSRLPWKYAVPDGVEAAILAFDGARRCASMANRPRLCPSVSADIIIEALCADKKTTGIVLVRRKNKPVGWALPGGFVEYGEDVWDAAHREAQEETSAVCRKLYLVGVYGRPDRDPRSHVQTAVFLAKLEDMQGARFVGGDDAAEARVYPLDALPEPLVFDHAQIIADYARMRAANQWPLAQRIFY